MNDINFTKWFGDTLESMEKLGEIYAEKKGTSWNLQEQRKVVLATQMKASGAKTSAEQEREALISEAYRVHLEGTAEAIKEEHKAKAKYDTIQARFEAIRSLSSLEKSKMNLI